MKEWIKKKGNITCLEPEFFQSFLDLTEASRFDLLVKWLIVSVVPTRVFPIYT
jgi:hypothetical protein